MDRQFIPPFDLKFSEEDKRWILARFEQILSSGFVSAFKNVHEFEEKLKEFFKVKYAVATSCGTSALEMILRAIDVKGKTVIMPSMTFMATAFAAVHAGARVIFVDCQRENLQMDPLDLERKLRDDTKAVIIVHLTGIISPHIEEIENICKKRGITLVEDAAHAHGAQFKDRMAGSFGIATALSFFSTKVLTMGEGGAVITNNEEIYKKCLILRDQGRPGPEPNIHTELGYNWRASEFNAVLGIRQLEKGWDIIEKRRYLAKLYDELLQEKMIEEIELVKIPKYIKSAYYKYVVFLKPPLEREKLKKHLKEKYGVCLSGEVYNQACHNQPVWDKLPEAVVRIEGEDFSNTEYVAARHICLPLYPSLNEDNIKYVVNSLEKAIYEIKKI